MKRSLFILTFLAAILAVNPLFAQARYNIKEMTPEVQRALDGRKDRFNQLSDFKAGGVVGENNRGYVELLEENGTAKRLVADENRDRQVIYLTIARQNGIEDQLAVIEGVFAQVQREKATAGEMIQNESGQWIAK